MLTSSLQRRGMLAALLVVSLTACAADRSPLDSTGPSLPTPVVAQLAIDGTMAVGAIDLHLPHYAPDAITLTEGLTGGVYAHPAGGARIIVLDPVGVFAQVQTPVGQSPEARVQEAVSPTGESLEALRVKAAF
jgi:hypothetical protein